MRMIICYDYHDVPILFNDGKRALYRITGATSFLAKRCLGVFIYNLN